METLFLEMGFPDGDGSLIVGVDHPLVAVFRRAVKTGAPTGEWMFLILRPSAKDKPKLIGTIAWTPGERFLFFPGKPVEVQSSLSRDKFLNGHMLDHVTLELDETKSKYSEHVAVLGRDTGRSRGQPRSGVIHKGMLHPWFSLLLQDLNGYDDLPATFKFEFTVPKSDLERRAQAIMGREGKRTETTFPEQESEGPHYYQMDVWAGRGDSLKSKYADVLPSPSVEGMVEGHRGEAVTRAAQFHDIGDDCGIVIVLTRPSGLLKKPGLIHMAIEPTRKADKPS